MTPTPFRPGVDLPKEQVDANRRYWESDESVNGIAEAMELSKGRLYELLLPFDAGHPCPACGTPLGFPHRTARQRGDVACGRCGFEGELSTLPSAAATGDGSPAEEEGPGSAGSSPAEGSRADTVQARRHPAEGAGETAPDPAPRLWHAGAANPAPHARSGLVGAALVGIGVGLLLARWLRR